MGTNENMFGIMYQISGRALLDENTAIRLYNSVSPVTNNTMQSMDSVMSICSANEMGQSCRICRWNRPDLPLQQCPCECKGSVGYVHLKCLRRWIVHRGNDHCEICGTKFILSPEKKDYRKLFWSFFQSKYLGTITRNCAHLISLAPISYVVLYQVLQVMDNLQLEEHNTLQIIVLAPALILTSSLDSMLKYDLSDYSSVLLLGIIFFHILEFSITRGLVITNVLKHWWNFGGQDTDSGLDVDVPSELFEYF